MKEPPKNDEKDQLMQDLNAKTDRLEQIIDQIIGLQADQKRVQAEVIELQTRLTDLMLGRKP